MDMDKKIAQLQARINLLEESLKGMEELVIHLVEKETSQRDPLSWRRPVVTPQA